MANEGPMGYRVTWTGSALDVLAELLLGTKHGQSYPAWVEQKFEECVLEVIRRLELFPDLRIRYIVAGLRCSGMTLRALPLQVFYRQIGADEITVFTCRWASRDLTGAQDLGG